VKRYISIAAILTATMVGVLALAHAQPAAAGGTSISGVVYQDLNNNGVKDPGEPGIPGVTITLQGTESSTAGVTQTTTTDANGAFSFSTGVCCLYSVTETQPAGFDDGLDSAGSQECAPTVGNDAISNIDVDCGTVSGLTFGELPLATPTSEPTEQQKLKTHTPTTTATSTVTPTPRPATSTPVPASPTKPAGAAAGAVRPPDTGTGGSSSSATSTRELAMLAVALMAVGGVAAGQGIRRRMRRRD
jgi:hypothetical protein